ncbi:uncharacterized protein LOC126874333 isoform X16 [Bombus huntii]|uniref:uncharacterized protein LOC126874333 isoform X16 n=1 Tax=Bombus huntii TaxID=85661 RepID=UPI0021AAFD48|nr:uncharacterized protein LOC126874333 isoform X16 [Bombus huntii]
MMPYYIALAVICMCARQIFQHGRSRVFLVWRWFNVNNSTYSMLRHLPGSFPQRRPILRYALDTYYGCLQSSYICGYKAGAWCSASWEP